MKQTAEEIAEQAENAARCLAMLSLNVGCCCRKCGGEWRSAKVATRYLAGGRVKCSRCGWYGTWRDNTVLERTELNCRQFLALWYRYTMGETKAQVAGVIGVSRSTVSEWQRRLESKA